MSPEFEQDYARYLAGEMTDEERQSFEQWVAADATLSEEVYADLNLASKIESRKVVPIVSRWWRWAAPIAAAALILVAVNVMNPGVEETSPVMRGGDVRVELVAPVGVVDLLPSRFEWQPVSTATRYRFELLDETARVLRRTVVVATFVIIDGGVPERGAWRVVALNDLGEELASGPPMGFELRH